MASALFNQEDNGNVVIVLKGDGTVIASSDGQLL